MITYTRLFLHIVVAKILPTHGSQMLGVQICDEDIRGTSVQKSLDKGRYLLRDIRGEFRVIPADLCVGDVDIIVADPEEMHGFLAHTSLDIGLDLLTCWRRTGATQLGGHIGVVKIRGSNRVVDSSTEIRTSPSMTESEILRHWHVQVICEIGNRDLFVRPCTRAIDLVVRVILVCNVVRIAPVTIV